MDKKYLSNGKKVAVIGKINQTEYIVQEIFVTESGDELPSGEKFTTKSLHDTPVVSYQERRLAELDRSVSMAESSLKSIKREVEALTSEKRTLVSIGYNIKKSARSLEAEEGVELLQMFLSGRLKYAVDYSGWSISAPIKIPAALEGGRYDRDHIKLITLCGRSDGKLDFKIGQYSDGSGSSTSYKFFATRKEALAFIKEEVVHREKSGKVYLRDLELCRSVGIKLPKKLIKDVVNREEQNLVESRKKEIDKINNRNAGSFALIKTLRS